MNEHDTPIDGAKTGAVDHILIFDPVSDEIFVDRSGKTPRPIHPLTPVDADSKGDHD
jgi:hypothetical protein